MGQQQPSRGMTITATNAQGRKGFLEECRLNTLPEKGRVRWTPAILIISARRGDRAIGGAEDRFGRSRTLAMCGVTSRSTRGCSGARTRAY